MEETTSTWSTSDPTWSHTRRTNPRSFLAQTSSHAVSEESRVTQAIRHKYDSIFEGAHGLFSMSGIEKMQLLGFVSSRFLFGEACKMLQPGRAGRW